MRTLISGLAVAAPLLLLGASRSEAQYVVTRGYTRAPAVVTLPNTGTTYVNEPIVSGGLAPAPYYIPSVATYGRIGTANVNGTYVPPYNYTVVPPPWPARHYQGYGNSDFPFYGKTYGRPYDAWSWPYLGGGYYNSLARYYYPPVL